MNKHEPERVVVTGLGAITPVGNNVQDFWHSIRNGVSGCAPITRFDATDYKTKIACEVKDFDPSSVIEKREVRRLDLFSQFATAAAAEAVTDSGIDFDAVDPERTAVILGIGIGGFLTIEESYGLIFAHGPHRMYPLTIPKLISNIGPAHIAIRYNAHGSVYSIATACASGTDAIGQARQYIQDGIGDIVITGGSEACITRTGVAGFNALQTLSVKYNSEPTRASRPFDADRDGFVIGEGAGILILESLSHARARNATIYAEIVGFSSTNDAYHFTSPHPEGRGIIAAMQNSLKDADIAPEEIGYINAHGTSTLINDRVETESIKKIFGKHAYKLKISSTKSMHGHTIGATGGIEAIACIKALYHSFIPPTINYETPDPDCDLDYVPNKGVSTSFQYAMSNSLGFGGHNGVLVIKSWPKEES